MASPLAFDPQSLNDPFTQGYKRILAIINGYLPLSKLLGQGNVQDLSNIQLTTLKDLLTSSDTNNLLLLQSRSVEKPFGSNSMVAEIEQDYSMIIATDALSVIPLNQLKWLLFRAFVSQGSDNLGLPFVFSYVMAGGEDSTTTPVEQIAQSKRWAHVKTVTLKMKFDVRQLQ